MKKALTIFGMAAMATGIFISNEVKADQSLDLASLIELNSANAECQSTPINNGRCSFTGNCFPDAGGTDNNCDSTKGS